MCCFCNELICSKTKKSHAIQMYCMGRNIRGSTLLVLFLAVIREISAFSNTLWHFVCRNPPFFHNRTSHSDDNGVTGHPAAPRWSSTASCQTASSTNTLSYGRFSLPRIPVLTEIPPSTSQPTLLVNAFPYDGQFYPFFPCL